MKHLPLTASLLGTCILSTVALARSSTPSRADPASGESSTPPAVQASPRSFDHTKATAAARFKSLDTDGDERISRAEFALGSPLSLEADPGITGGTEKALDPHVVDGKTREARVAGGSNSFERFNELDTNKDGFVSLDELAAQDNKGVKG